MVEPSVRPKELPRPPGRPNETAAVLRPRSAASEPRLALDMRRPPPATDGPHPPLQARPASLRPDSAAEVTTHHATLRRAALRRRANKSFPELLKLARLD